jgi:pimeloyl-ACP methyl ester carboxylesterase
MIGSVLAGLAALIVVPVVGGLAWRKAHQRRKAKALEIGTPNGIVEQRFVKLGGIDQWIQIRGEDRANPVLLVLHGGPGWPNAVFTLPLRPWEQHFTVVQWDHRGAGKTMRRNGKAGSGPMTFDQRVADAVELIEFLRRHLSVDKVVVLAESMGTLTGLPLALRRPDLLHALVVTDLYVNMAVNEARKWQLTLKRLRAAGTTRGVTALEGIGPDPASWDLRAWNTNMAWAFKTNLPTPKLDRRLLFPLALSSPLYSLRDLASLFVGFQWSTAQMFQELRAYDARRLGSRFEVPFFLFQGEADVITLTSLATEYFHEVQAPAKGLALIPDAGHFAAFTHPDRFLAELRLVPAARRPHRRPRAGSDPVVPQGDGVGGLLDPAGDQALPRHVGQHADELVAHPHLPA